MPNALSVATRGKKTTTRRRRNTGRTSTSLVKAQQQVARLQNKAKRAAIMTKQSTQQLILTGETQAALFASAWWTGRRGDEGVKWGNFDSRVVVGGLAAVLGLVQTWNGDEIGNHALAIGSGVLGSVVYEMGHSMGEDSAAEGFSGRSRISGRRAYMGGRQHAGIYR